MALTGWKYKRKITIDNSNNSNTLTDYQIKTDLTSNNFDFAKANSDGSDIRFLDNDNSTSLNYWIESWDSSGQTATIWTEVSSIPASSTYDIYMYYGNNNASSESNGDNTFDFFDDFNGSSIDTNKWTVKKKGSTNAIVELDGNGNLHLAGKSKTISSGNVLSTATFTNGFAIRARRKYTKDHYADISIGNGTLQDMDDGGQSKWWHTTQGDGYSWAQQSLTAHYIMKTPSGAAKTKLANDDSNSWGATNTFEEIEFIYDSSGLLKWIRNGVEKLSATNTSYLSSDKYLLLSQGEYSDGHGGDSYYDWIRIRKYTSSEPTTSVGVEIKMQIGNTIFFSFNF